MMSRNYYCLVAGLPDLIPDDKKLHFSSAGLRDYLAEELHPDDFEMVKLFYLPWDHDNLLSLLFKTGKDFDPRGNFPADQLEQLCDKKQFETIDTSLFPAYFIDFINFYHDEEEETTISACTSYLNEAWFSLLQNHSSAFLNQFARYKLSMGNILLALNGRKHNLPYDEGLMGNDEITHALRKSRSRDFGLSTEVTEIEEIIQIFETENILERELRLANHFWQYLDEITFFNYFTAERILAFVQKLFIAERWYHLNKEKGQEIFTRLLQELQSNFEFPEEFALTYGKRN